MLLGIRAFGGSYSITRWPTSPGRIVRSFVQELSPGRYVPVVEYEFILAGRVYRGSDVSGLGDTTVVSSRTAADSMVMPYPEGMEMKVHYDPTDFRRSLLAPSLDWLTLLPVIAGLGIMLAGAWLRGYGLRTLNPVPPE